MLGPSVNIHEGKGSLDLFFVCKVLYIFLCTSFEFETYVMGSRTDNLMETVLLKTRNICFS